MGVRIKEELCTGCGICIDECPHDVFVTSEVTGKAEVAYPAECHNCYYAFFCARACPVEGAIETDSAIAYKVWWSL